MKKKDRTVELTIVFAKETAKQLLEDNPGKSLYDIVVEAYDAGLNLTQCTKRPIGFRSEDE